MNDIAVMLKVYSEGVLTGLVQARGYCSESDNVRAKIDARIKEVEETIHD